jgi:hypothetical protein
MERRRTSVLSLLAWLPLVAALALAAGSARTAVAVLLMGLGGYVASPLAELTIAPIAVRVRRVRRARAPATPGHCCVR